MKEAKICIIAVIVTSLIIISTAFALPAYAEAAPVTSADYYGKLVVVTNSTQLETSIWIVSCQDKNGNLWEFLNDEGLEQGDILTLLMFRLNEREEDDECMDYMYEGHTDNINLFFQVMGWR